MLERIIENREMPETARAGRRNVRLCISDWHLIHMAQFQAFYDRPVIDIYWF